MLTEYYASNILIKYIIFITMGSALQLSINCYKKTISLFAQ